MAQDTQTPRFLGISLELRREIYKHLLRQPQAIDVCGIWSRKLAKRVAGLSLLEVCRRTYREAGDYFYSNNTFTLLEHCDGSKTDNGNVLSNECLQWLFSIGPRNGHSIRRLQLYMRAERPYPASAPENYYYAQLLEVRAVAQVRVVER